jgi:hypothetical protein
MVRLLIPLESLVDSITKLSLAEKRLLGELLAEPPTVQTEIREARPVYPVEAAPPLDEHIVELKRQVASLLDTLPETKLAVVFDFVQFLTEQERQINWMNAQRQSAAYQEWAGSDNDIYDEIFADAYPAR